MNKRAVGCSDRPGNWSLGRLAKSEKVPSGFAAEVSGHVGGAAESAVPAPSPVLQARVQVVPWLAPCLVLLPQPRWGSPAVGRVSETLPEECSLPSFPYPGEGVHGIQARQEQMSGPWGEGDLGIPAVFRATEDDRGSQWVTSAEVAFRSYNTFSNHLTCLVIIRFEG